MDCIENIKDYRSQIEQLKQQYASQNPVISREEYIEALYILFDKIEQELNDNVLLAEYKNVYSDFRNVNSSLPLEQHHLSDCMISCLLKLISNIN